MNVINLVERRQMKMDLTPFRVGDTVRVQLKITEGEKERLQAFEGVVMRIHRNGLGSTFTVRMRSYGVGVERVFPIHSPRVAAVEVISSGRVRRSRLYYLRELSGKKARLKERRTVAPST